MELMPPKPSVLQSLRNDIQLAVDGEYKLLGCTDMEPQLT